jgi:hypothetical protein
MAAISDEDVAPRIRLRRGAPDLAAKLRNLGSAAGVVKAG